MMELFWTPESIQDRDGIYDYIEANNARTAMDLDDLFMVKAAYLATHFGLGRRGRVARTRELVVHPNYIVIYDIAGELVRILRVLHATQQWPPADKS